MNVLSLILFVCWFAAGVLFWPVAQHLFGFVIAPVAALNVYLAWRSWRVFTDARKQSRSYAPAVAGALREGKVTEAIKISQRFTKSHLARTVLEGLIEFQRTPQFRMGAVNGAMDRARVTIVDEYRRTQRILAISRLSVLGVGGFVVLFAASVEEACTVIGITLYAAAPAWFALAGSFDDTEGKRVEMESSQSEVIDYFIKRSARSSSLK